MVLFLLLDLPAIWIHIRPGHWVLRGSFLVREAHSPCVRVQGNTFAPVASWYLESRFWSGRVPGKNEQNRSQQNSVDLGCVHLRVFYFVGASQNGRYFHWDTVALSPVGAAGVGEP